MTRSEREDDMGFVISLFPVIHSRFYEMEKWEHDESSLSKESAREKENVAIV